MITSVTWGVVVLPPPASGLVTDLGYTVQLDRAELVLHTVDLVPAVEQPRFLGWFPLAQAGHAPITDPSAVDTQRTVDLLVGGRVVLGERSFAPTAYGAVHWLAAPPTRSMDPSLGPSSRAPSFRVQGRWTRGDASGVIELAVPWPASTVLPLPAPGRSALAVDLVFTSEGLFDGVELATEATGTVAGRALENLAKRVTVRVAPTSPATHGAPAHP